MDRPIPMTDALAQIADDRRYVAYKPLLFASALSAPLFLAVVCWGASPHKTAKELEAMTKDEWASSYRFDVNDRFEEDMKPMSKQSFAKELAGEWKVVRSCWGIAADTTCEKEPPGPTIRLSTAVMTIVNASSIDVDTEPCRPIVFRFGQVDAEDYIFEYRHEPQDLGLKEGAKLTLFRTNCEGLFEEFFQLNAHTLVIFWNGAFYIAERTSATKSPSSKPTRKSG